MASGAGGNRKMSDAGSTESVITTGSAKPTTNYESLSQRCGLYSSGIRGVVTAKWVATGGNSYGVGGMFTFRASSGKWYEQPDQAAPGAERLGGAGSTSGGEAERS